MMLRVLIICLFFPAILPAQRYADCDSALYIAEKKLYVFQPVAGEGADTIEAATVMCFMNAAGGGRAERNSTWLRFRIDTSGTLLLTLTPAVATDDVDFVLYRLPGGDCREKKIVRCMAAYAATGPCAGATGLAAGENDVLEDQGCDDAGDNAWLAPLRAKAGEHYALLISNMTSTAGYSLLLSGTAVLASEARP
jgi:hypothetical protein